MPVEILSPRRHLATSGDFIAMTWERVLLASGRWMAWTLLGVLQRIPTDERVSPKSQ